MQIRFECRRLECDGVMALTEAADATASSDGPEAETVCHRVCPKCGTLHAYESASGFVCLLEGHEAEDILADVGRARLGSTS